MSTHYTGWLTLRYPEVLLSMATQPPMSVGAGLRSHAQNTKAVCNLVSGTWEGGGGIAKEMTGHAAANIGAGGGGGQRAARSLEPPGPYHPFTLVGATLPTKIIVPPESGLAPPVPPAQPSSSWGEQKTHSW